MKELRRIGWVDSGQTREADLTNMAGEGAPGRLCACA